MIVIFNLIYSSIFFSSFSTFKALMYASTCKFVIINFVSTFLLKFHISNLKILSSHILACFLMILKNKTEKWFELLNHLHQKLSFWLLHCSKSHASFVLLFWTNASECRDSFFFSVEKKVEILSHFLCILICLKCNLWRMTYNFQLLSYALLFLNVLLVSTSIWLNITWC